LRASHWPKLLLCPCRVWAPFASSLPSSFRLSLPSSLRLRSSLRLCLRSSFRPRNTIGPPVEDTFIGPMRSRKPNVVFGFTIPPDFVQPIRHVVSADPDIAAANIFPCVHGKAHQGLLPHPQSNRSHYGKLAHSRW
jgi:hypothetical protein